MGIMEIKKKLNTPSGNTHDIKYLYNVIAGLKRKGGRVESNPETFKYFKKMINDYNDAKASKFGLSSKPKEVDIKVVNNIIAELKYIKLIRKENGHLALTNEGENIASLIEEKDSERLKEVFAKLMIENYRVFEYFLKRIKEVSGGKGIPIPSPSVRAEVLDKSGGNPEIVVERYVKIINENYPPMHLNLDSILSLLKAKNVDTIDKKTKKIKNLQAVIEKYVVSEIFQPNIKSRRAYDFVRSRTTFLELTNYAIFDFEGFPAEVTYLISDFEPTFNHATKTVDYSGGRVYINYPAFEDMKDIFKETIAKNYNTYKDDFGYMKIAAVRDTVCRELKISDNLFDIYLKKLYEEEPHWLSFTYAGAGDKITEKRLPIIFEKPMREFFTLLKVNLRR